LRSSYLLQAYGITSDEAKEVYYTFRNDNPIFYYTSNVYYDMGNDIVRYFFLSIFDDFAYGSVRKEYNETILEYIESYSSCVKGISKYEDAKAIHDKLILSMDYEYEDDGITAAKNGKAHSIIGALEGNGVCEAYARMYQMICNYYEIDNVFVSGYSSDISKLSGNGHTWNLIKVDDGAVYYIVDCTGDDLGENELRYDYFLKGSNTLQYIAGTPEEHGMDFLYELPEINENDYYTFIIGDVNFDGVFNIADAVNMQQWILAMPDMTLANWKAGDLCADNIINVFDLILMKKLLINVS